MTSVPTKGKRIVLKELVVNADDWGAGPGVHEAVVRAHETGVVTSASVVTVGPECERALRYAESHPTLGVGIHLALTEWAPAAPEAWTERGYRDGRMPADYRRLVPALLRMRHGAGLIEAEWRGQYRRFFDFGLGAPDHADAHQHVHLWPALWTVFRDLAREFGVPFVRVPVTPADARRVESGAPLRMAGARALSTVAARRLSEARRHGLRTADRVVGFVSGGRLESATALRVAGALPDGVTEWITHPGATWTRPVENGERETRALCDPELARRLKDEGVRLVNFGELARRA